MPLTELNLNQWLLAMLAALCVGLAKSGFGGVGMFTILIMAWIMPAYESTGIVLPLLICGDIFAVAAFRKHAQWAYIWKLLPPALIGIVAGYFLMPRIPRTIFGPVIGWIVLMMVVLQSVRQFRPGLFEKVPHTRGFAWMMGTWSGVTTMMANAAGPVMALYLLAVNLPKYELVGTSAWFFFIVNVIKVPFSSHLGLINSGTLAFNLALAPFVLAGIFAGRALIQIVPQKLFEQLLLLFAAAASVRLILG
ncbi:MAG: sulfite exporter TauE/SafE family protein [Methylacidiphilales bacterium]|nr:sulfite exporter TauE/SafE family protein [Candidatus Methylacidiphilales bacterium]